MLHYKAVPGGAIKRGLENHTRNMQEEIVIAHRVCPSDQPFTCNRRVVVTDVYGHSTGRFPHVEQTIFLDALPPGAPNGGSRCLFPSKCLHYLIGR